MDKAVRQVLIEAAQILTTSEATYAWYERVGCDRRYKPVSEMFRCLICDAQIEVKAGQFGIVRPERRLTNHARGAKHLKDARRVLDHGLVIFNPGAQARVEETFKRSWGGVTKWHTLSKIRVEPCLGVLAGPEWVSQLLNAPLSADLLYKVLTRAASSGDFQRALMACSDVGAGAVEGFLRGQYPEIFSGKPMK